MARWEIVVHAWMGTITIGGPRLSICSGVEICVSPATAP